MSMRYQSSLLGGSTQIRLLFKKSMMEKKLKVPFKSSGSIIQPATLQKLRSEERIRNLFNQ